MADGPLDDIVRRLLRTTDATPPGRGVSPGIFPRYITLIIRGAGGPRLLKEDCYDEDPRH